MSSKLIIAGGSGSIGNRLIAHFSSRFNEIIVLSRAASQQNESYKVVQWDARTEGDWISELNGSDALINLTGKSIQTRFTEKNKKILLSSRIDSTKVLTKAISKLDDPPSIWLNASGAAIYPSSIEHASNEDTLDRGTGFLAQLSAQWEQAFFSSEFPRTRQIAMRITPVLDPEEGFLPSIISLAKIGLGGKQGTGNQMISWIHHVDLCRAIEFIINQKDISGPVNMSSPNPLSNSEFMRQVRKSIGISISIATPAFALKLGSVFSGVDPSLILDSSYVHPKLLLEHDFEFKYEDLDHALDDLM